MGEHRWSLGGTSIQLPILHQNQGAIGEAEAKRAELATRFTTLQLRIIGDIDKARAGLSAVTAKWTAAEQQRQYEHAHVQAVQALLHAGETDAVAVLTAELVGAAAERTRLDTLVESQQAAALLEDALRYPIASTLSTTTINNATLRNTHP
jgi:outer membrane protein TolC